MADNTEIGEIKDAQGLAIGSDPTSQVVTVQMNGQLVKAILDTNDKVNDLDKKLTKHCEDNGYLKQQVQDNSAAIGDILERLNAMKGRDIALAFAMASVSILALLLAFGVLP